MDTELSDHLLSSNHIMELDYTLDADMVSPDRFHCELQSDPDQFMAPIQSTDPQEVEMTDDYPSVPFSYSNLSELTSRQKTNGLVPITSQPPITDFPTFIDSSFSTFATHNTNLPPSSTSDLTSSILVAIEHPVEIEPVNLSTSDSQPFASQDSVVPIENPVEIEPLHFSTSDSQVFASQISLPLVHLPEPIHASDEAKQLESRDPASSLNDQNLSVAVETSEQVALSIVSSGVGSTSGAEPHVAPHEDEPHSITQPTIETLSALAQHEDGEQSVTVADEVTLDSLPLDPSPELTTAAQTSIEEPIESLNADDLTEVDESLELHPRPRTDLLEHVRTEFEVLDIVDENKLDTSEQMIKQAPCIRLLCQDCEYSLFQSLSASNSSNDLISKSSSDEEPLLLGDLEHQAIYFAPLRDFIESLRQIFPDFTQTDHSELVLSFPDLEARIPEDNVYTRELSLFDIDRLHVGANLPSRLLVSLEKQPRLIHRFNVLAKHVWKQTLTEPLDAEEDDTEEDSYEEYQAERAPEHTDGAFEEATITEESLDRVQEGLTVEEDTAGKTDDASSSAVHSNPPMISEGGEALDLPVRSPNVSSQPFDSNDVSTPIIQNVAGHSIAEVENSEHVQTECVAKATFASLSQSTLDSPTDLPRLENSLPGLVEAQDQHPDGMDKDLSNSAIPLDHLVAETTFESDLQDDQTVDCDSPTDATADGEELDSVEASQEASKNPTIGTAPAAQLDQPNGLPGPDSNLNHELVEPVISKCESVDDDELISNGTVLGCEGSDDFDDEEITDARFDTIIDNSPLLNSITFNSNDLVAASLPKEHLISGLVGSYDLSRSPNETKKRPVDYDDDAYCTNQDEKDEGSPQSDTKRVRTL